MTFVQLEQAVLSMMMSVQLEQAQRMQLGLGLVSLLGQFSSAAPAF